MQAIHNRSILGLGKSALFQRAKIQDKCKQFTTQEEQYPCNHGCFKEQRYKINASNSQHFYSICYPGLCCFKEQRYKINASNSQLKALLVFVSMSCFKEQRYKINASNSQRRGSRGRCVSGCFKEQRYKINASNSQQAQRDALVGVVVSKSKDTR